MKAIVEKDLVRRLAMDQPAIPHGKGATYEAIRPRFHNPLEIAEHFKQEGFAEIQLHWYHRHAAPPLIEGRRRKRIWEEAGRFEHQPPTWRDCFLCSAFVVEATRVR